MEVYATEEQQVEALKNWFKKHGNTLLWILAIVMGSIAAVNYWRHHQEVLREQASQSYLGVIQALEQKDKTTAKAKTDALIQEHANSPYAALGSFALAKFSIVDNDLAQGEEYLKWITNHAKQPNFKALGRVRLMRLYYDQNKLSEALALYDEKMAGDFFTLMAELKGDVLLKQNDRDGAIQAYQTAKKAAPEDGMYGPLLKMKLENLGVEATK